MSLYILDQPTLGQLVSLDRITRLLPRQESPYADEAEAMVRQFVERWNIKPWSFEDYNTMSRFLYPASISAERLAAACTVHSIFFFIDDLFFDTDLLNPADYGIDETLAQNPARLRQFLASLMHTFRTGDVPPDPLPIQRGFQEIGQQIRALASPGWFDYFADTVQDYIKAVISREADLGSRRVSLQDLTSFTDIRERDTGGLHTCVLIELAGGFELPDRVREDETIRYLTTLCIRMASFVNDICSYHKDVVIEGSQFNMVKMFMDNEGLSFPVAVEKSIQVVNAYADAFLEAEQRLPTWDEETDTIARQYVMGLKELMSGNVFWHLTTNRYRSPDSPFVELRNVT